MSVLDEILRSKREELKDTKILVPLADLKARVRDMEPTIPFKDAIVRNNQGSIRLIAEVKKASPSKGIIRQDFDIESIISIYNKKDVSAISIITESKFFSGDLNFIQRARSRTRKPILRKDFIFDEYQIYESRACGADAVLLIVAALERPQLYDLYALAKELSLECLVEVHNLKELDTALYCNAEIIGINNRNLSTLEVDISTTKDLIKDIPRGKVTVSESGIDSYAQVRELEAVGVDAILVGTSIMESPDIEKKIDELMGKG
jgi:indole-3-glycerol phosphate synthase